MTKEIKLNAEIRKSVEGKLEKVNIKDFVPAVIYGPGAENRFLKIKKNDFDRIYNEAGESNLIDLTVDGSGAIKTLIKEVQRDNVKSDYLHVDFYQVDMNKKITTQIPLEFIGESKAVKELGMILVKNMDSIEVECLPSDLVDHITVDVSVINTKDDSIKVSDLKLPQGMVILDRHPEDIVANVVEQKVEEEVKVEAPTEGTEAPAAAAADKAEEEAPTGENK